jgi:hypothetical protein
MEGEITKTEILNQEDPIDIEQGLVGVVFEFECPDGKTGDSVAFFDKTVVEGVLVKSIFEKRFTTESAQVLM